MRELNRPKTRITFTLDQHRVTALFIVGIVVVAVIFAIGVLVGKRLGSVASPQTPQAVSALPTPKAAAGPEMPSEHGTLAAAPKADAPPATAPVVTPEEASQKAEALKAIEASAKAGATPEAKPETPPAAEPQKVEEKLAATGGKAAAPAPAAEPETLVAKEKAKEADKPKEKEEKKTEVKKTEVEPAADTNQTQAPDGKYYTLQIASFPNKDKAEDFIHGFKAFDKRKPFVTTHEVPGKGTWYRVKIGKFASKEQALAYQSIFEAKAKLSTILALE